MAIYNRYMCYLLQILLFLHHSVSLNVEELCAKRCLYGRGGVLCNCNAMHFNGKRSGPTHQTEYISQDTAHIPDTYFRKGSLLRHENNPYEMNARHEREDAIDGDNSEVFGISWRGRDLDNMLSNVNHGTSSDLVQGNNEDVKYASQAEVQSSSPMLLLHENKLHRDDANISLEDRRELASKIRYILSHSMGEPDGAVQGDLTDDLTDDFHEDDDLNNDPSKQQLVRLKDVLARVSHRR